jgi:hypothetical protein
MRTYFLCLSLSAALGFGTQALANAGATSAGVTTSGGNQNEPSADVEAQSSGFVQQNQQLPNAQSPGGAALPAGVNAVAPGAAAQSGAANRDGSNSGAKDGSTASATAVAAPPATPPPPPPVYESAMHRVERPPPMTVEASGPRGAVQKHDDEPMPDNNPEPKPEPAPKVVPAKPVAANVAARAPAPAIVPPAERIAAPPAVVGGRGEAPDGFTFYSGVTIAGALLAFGFLMFVRIGRNEGTK